MEVLRQIRPRKASITNSYNDDVNVRYWHRIVRKNWIVGTACIIGVVAILTLVVLFVYVCV